MEREEFFGLVGAELSVLAYKLLEVCFVNFGLETSVTRRLCHSCNAANGKHDGCME